MPGEEGAAGASLSSGGGPKQPSPGGGGPARRTAAPAGGLVGGLGERRPQSGLEARPPPELLLPRVQDPRAASRARRSGGAGGSSVAMLRGSLPPAGDCQRWAGRLAAGLTAGQLARLVRKPSARFSFGRELHAGP